MQPRRHFCAKHNDNTLDRNVTMPSSLESLKACPPPLITDVNGVVRVGGTRVRLETVIGAFNFGNSPEEILLRYPATRH